MNPKKELSMEVRLLLAFLLMGAVLMVSQFLLPQPPPPPGAGAAAKPEVAAGANPPAAPPQPAPAPAKKAEKPGAPPEAAVAVVKAESEEEVVLANGVIRAVFSNRGGVLRSVTLVKFKDGHGQPLNVIDPKAAEKVGWPLSLYFKNRSVPADPNQALYLARVSEDKLGVEFEYADARILVKKSFRLRPESYLAEVSSSVAVDGVPAPHALAWRGGFGDRTVFNPVAAQHTVHYNTSDNKLTVHEAKEAKDGPISHSGTFSFAGLEDQYFAAVLLPEGNGQIEMTTFADKLPAPPDGKEEAIIGAAISGGAENRFEFFIGPKDSDLLRTVHPKLSQLIDWGWFGILAKPLFVALNYTNDKITKNYGWAIVFVTVVLNLLLLPLKFSSLKSAKKMQRIQPELKKIQDRYASLPLKDPRRADMNAEMMDLYKKHGVNPLGGCLPLLIQMPFLFAFYKVLTVAIEMRGASWLWVSDLSQPETLPIRVLPLIMLVTQFILQKMTPTTGMDPAQARIMLIMPLFLGFMFYYQSAGLVLYWLTGNVIGIAQQWFTNRMGPPAPVTAATAPAAKTSRK
jgi:YidC/Oxa1 family membrane protein insertase